MFGCVMLFTHFYDMCVYIPRHICDLVFWGRHLCNYAHVMFSFLIRIHVVPSKGVDQISIIWTNENSVNVSWDPLSLLDCRGFPYYIVSYSSLEKGTTGSLNTTGSSVIFSGLDQQQSGYIFTFQVTTGNGTINGPVTVSELKIALKKITII